MRKPLAFALLGLAFGLASWLGWWAVPAVAALWGLLRPPVARPVLWASLAAGLAWAGWLVVDLVRAPEAVLRLGSRVAAVLQVPWPVPVLVSLLFPALLAWSSAALAGALAGWREPGRREGVRNAG